MAVAATVASRVSQIGVPLQSRNMGKVRLVKERIDGHSNSSSDDSRAAAATTRARMESTAVAAEPATMSTSSLCAIAARMMMS